MATRVVSAAGGNWNAVGTWVGGVIPLTTDDIQLAATSGPLVVNVNASILRINITTFYSKVLTINASITLTLTGGGTSTFGSVQTGFGYNFLGTGAAQGRITKTGAASFTYDQNGTVPLPHFQNSSSSTMFGGGGGTLYFVNLTNTSTLNIDSPGNFIYISGSFDSGTNAAGGETRYRMIGTGTLNVQAFGVGTNANELHINTSGTITIAAAGFGLGTGAGPDVAFGHTTGTVINPTIRAALNPGRTHTLRLVAGTTWDFYGIATGASTSTIQFEDLPTFDKFILNQTTHQLSAPTITFQNGSPAPAAVVVNELNVFTSLSNVGGTYYRASLDIVFASLFVMIVNSIIDLNGGSAEPNATQTPPLEIRSPSGSANLTVNTYNQYISRVRFTNINCSGGLTVYGQALTLTSTVNIQQYTLPPGGPSSHVFFS